MHPRPQTWPGHYGKANFRSVSLLQVGLSLLYVGLAAAGLGWSWQTSDSDHLQNAQKTTKIYILKIAYRQELFRFLFKPMLYCGSEGSAYFASMQEKEQEDCQLHFFVFLSFFLMFVCAFFFFPDTIKNKNGPRKLCPSYCTYYSWRLPECSAILMLYPFLCAIWCVLNMCHTSDSAMY